MIKKRIYYIWNFYFMRVISSRFYVDNGQYDICESVEKQLYWSWFYSRRNKVSAEEGNHAYCNTGLHNHFGDGDRQRSILDQSIMGKTAPVTQRRSVHCELP